MWTQSASVPLVRQRRGCRTRKGHVLPAARTNPLCSVLVGPHGYVRWNQSFVDGR
jgi:hypothetical protein